jgi:hypothetical protein
MSNKSIFQRSKIQNPATFIHKIVAIFFFLNIMDSNQLIKSLFTFSCTSLQLYYDGVTSFDIANFRRFYNYSQHILGFKLLRNKRLAFPLQREIGARGNYNVPHLMNLMPTRPPPPETVHILLLWFFLPFLRPSSSAETYIHVNWSLALMKGKNW